MLPRVLDVHAIKNLQSKNTFLVVFHPKTDNVYVSANPSSVIVIANFITSVMRIHLNFPYSKYMYM